jgi:hypothetical protein
MLDLVYVAVVVAFFAVAGGYVVACDRIIGPEPEGLVAADGGSPDAEPESESEEVAA